MVDMIGDKPDDELPPGLAKALSEARVPMAPPASVQDTTIAVLRERGLVYPRRRRMAIAWTAVAAAAILALVAWIAIRWTAAPVDGPRFVLLLYAGSDPIAGTADTRRSEYGAWARELASRGVQVSGEELAEESAALGAANGSAEGEALPRGFFVIRAGDLAEAQRIASTCPHLRYGGRIVIKRVAS
jgi:hypothetical protein